MTFDMRGAGKSTGRASLTGFVEIKDVIAVCKYEDFKESICFSMITLLAFPTITTAVPITPLAVQSSINNHTVLSFMNHTCPNHSPINLIKDPEESLSINGFITGR